RQGCPHGAGELGYPDWAAETAGQRVSGRLAAMRGGGRGGPGGGGAGGGGGRGARGGGPGGRGGYGAGGAAHGPVPACGPAGVAPAWARPGTPRPPARPRRPAPRPRARGRRRSVAPRPGRTWR